MARARHPGSALLGRGGFREKREKNLRKSSNETGHKISARACIWGDPF